MNGGWLVADEVGCMCDIVVVAPCERASDVEFERQLHVRCALPCQ